VLGAAYDLRGVERAADLPAVVVEVTERLVACEIPSYSEVDLDARTIVAVAPRRALFPGAEDVVGRYVHQDPRVSYFEETGDGSAVMLSDFMTQRQLHGLDLYDLVYRRVGLEHAVSLVVSHRRRDARRSATQTRVTVGRTSGGFSDRDRDVLNAVRPFLAQVKSSLDDVEQLRATIRDFSDAAAGERLVVVLGPEGRVADTNAPAAELLRRLGSRSAAELPEPLHSWARQHPAPGPDARPLMVEGPRGLLGARLIRGRSGNPAVIVLEPFPGEGSVASLSTLGLGQREALVLRAVAHGLSNAEVARGLGISRHTVAKHLQHVYAKLGVSNRTAAVRAARAATPGDNEQSRSGR
jgi:DNA-binding CsgD family transcriptional regulator